jgi:hypothetical protein
MKIIPGWRRRHYFNRASVFLTIAALIAGMVGYGGSCDGYNGGNGGDFVGSAQVAAGGINSNTVGLKCDGTVIAVGHNDFGQCNVGHWIDITQVASGGGQTVGLKSGGTVVAVGYNKYGQCNVGGWRGIVQVSAGMSYTVGLRSDGSVVAVGDNYEGQCDVGGWTDIKQVAAGVWHTVGCKSDGTVVAVGDNTFEQCSNVSSWTDIIQVAAGRYFTIGLKSDGTVVAVGLNENGQCNVGGWTDIIQVSTGSAFTVGLKFDGTVVATGHNWYGQCDVAGWGNITQVAAGPGHTVGLKSDYTVVATGSNGSGQCNVSHWILCNGPDPGTLFAGGNGTEGNPYQIANWHHLHNVRDYLDKHFILLNDLDSNTAGYDELAGPTAYDGKGWVPIWSYGHGFTGTFDGQGHKIHDMLINRPAEQYVGLFGRIGEGAMVENIEVVNADVTGIEMVGGLVGYNLRGTMNNCHATGTVVSPHTVGGLVGSNYGNVSNSWSSCTVTCNEYVAGGLVGYNSDRATVSNSYSTGSVTSLRIAGGLVGANDGTVSNSYANSNVVGISWSIGGLVGSNGGIVSDSHATGNVTGYEDVGGLVGWNSDTISNSYYNYDEVLINGENIITIGALFGEDFDQWLTNDKSLDVNERLSQESGYYVINDVNDFKQLLAFGQDGSLKFRLKNDLDLAAEPNFYIPYFAGEFDGNGHKISNLSFDFGFVSSIGLFGLLASGGKVTDLSAENVNITGAGFVGGLVGCNRGNVSNSHATGTVTGDYEYVAGLVGKNYGTVGNSYSTVNVNGNELVGGLIGFNSDTVSNSYSTGSVTGTSQVGGLVGRNGGNGNVINSFWDAETSGQDTSDGGTGKTTAEMQEIATFSGATWDIVAVANPSIRNPSYIWNIVDDETYPFLSWQS